MQAVSEKPTSHCLLRTLHCLFFPLHSRCVPLIDTSHGMCSCLNYEPLKSLQEGLRWLNGETAETGIWGIFLHSIGNQKPAL